MSVRERILWRFGWRYWSTYLVDGQIIEQWAGACIETRMGDVLWLGHELRYCPRSERTRG